MADEYDDEEEGGVQLSSEDLRNLRKAAKERNELQAQIEQQKRELAFAKANLDLNDPKLGYFIKGYEGDLTPEAIRAQALADGFIQQQQASNEELNAQQRIANASSGAGETTDPGIIDKMRHASSVEEVMKLAAEAGMPTSWNRPGA